MQRPETDPVTLRQLPLHPLCATSETDRLSLRDSCPSIRSTPRLGLARSRDATSSENDARSAAARRADVNMQNKDGNTPLHVGCAEGALEVVDALIRAKAN
eukprot:858656-Rhodomonas_salina.1